MGIYQVVEGLKLTKHFSMVEFYSLNTKEWHGADLKTEVGEHRYQQMVEKFGPPPKRAHRSKTRK